MAPGLIPSLFRLARPGITAAVLLTGYTGMVLGQGGIPGWRPTVVTLLALFAVSAGAVMLNGVIERGRDAGMRRLHRRLSALRRIGDGAAIAIGSTLIAAGTAAAWFLANRLTALLLVAAVVSYVPLYTLWLKRLTHGAVPGGIPGALPVLVGYGAARGTLGPDALLVFLILFLWQPPHFWLLALRHYDDYRQGGIPVPVVGHGDRYAGLLIRTYIFSLLPASLSLWLFGFCSWRYAVAVVLCWLPFAATAWRADRGTRTAFRFSILYLTALCLTVILDVVIAAG